jgi:hypothetical protein
LLGLVLVAGASARQNYSLFAAFGQPRPGSWLQTALTPIAPEAREAVERRLKRREGYELKTMVPEVAAFELKMAAVRRQEIERAIVRLIEAPSAEAEAVAFAASAKVYFEWETDPSAPLDEAASATEYLKAHPASVIEPYLRLYQLHRFRSAFEAAVFMGAHPYPEALGAATIARWRKQYRLMRDDAAAGYVAAWEAVRASSDIVIRTLADNLDTKAYLYLNVGAHPRQPQMTRGQRRDAAAIRRRKKSSSAIEAGSFDPAMAYRLGSYRIATAPEPNSSRPTSFKSSGVDSPANNAGPWPAIFIQSGLTPDCAADRNADSIIWYVTRPKRIAPACLMVSAAWRCSSSSGTMTR